MAQPPLLARLLRGRFKLVTFSFFLGFGLTACSSSGGREDSDEPVAAVDGQTPAADGDAAEAPDGNAAAADGDKMADAPGGDVADADEGKAAPGDEAMMPGDDMDGAKAEAKDDSAAATPPGMTDSPSDTVDAELTADQPPAAPTPVAVESGDDLLAGAAEPAPAAPAPPTSAAAAAAIVDSGDAMASTTTDAAAAATGSGNSVSSPGAARFIQGSHEGHHARRHKDGPSTASANTGAAGDAGSVYIVQQGDTLGAIAAKIYGSTREWKSLAEMNGLTATSVIHPGDAVKFDATNPKAQSFAKSYQGGRKTVEVKRGDTLCKLAAELYGSPAAWKMLYNYNKGKISDPNRIYAGMKLAYIETGAKGEQSASKSAAKPVEPKAMQRTAKTGKGAAKVADKSGSKSSEKSGSKRHKKAPIAPEDVAE